MASMVPKSIRGWVAAALVVVVVMAIVFRVPQARAIVTGQ